MSRLVLFTSLPEVGGHTTITLSLACLLREMFDDILVIAKEMPGHGTSDTAIAELRGNSIHTVVLPCNAKLQGMHSLLRCALDSEWYGSDVFLAMGMRHLSPVLSTLFRPSRSIYYHITHELSPSVCRTLTSYGHFFSQIAFISPATAEMWANGNRKGESISLIQPSALGLATSAHRHQSSVIRFGFMGRLDSAKGSEEMMRFAEMTSTPCELHIAGRGLFEDAFKDLERRTNLPVKTYFHGSFSGPSRKAFLEHFYGHVDYLVVPSQDDREGLPTVILEALEAGTPVIATRSGGITVFENPEFQPTDMKCVTLIERHRVVPTLAELAKLPAPHLDRREACRSYYSLKFSDRVLKTQWQRALFPERRPPKESMTRPASAIQFWKRR